MRIVFAVLAAALAAGCAGSGIKREIGLVEPLTARQCPAEAAVAWDAYGYYDFEAITAGFAEDAAAWGWTETAQPLSGDDVIVNFHIGPNIHVNRTDWVRAERRGGAWTVRTSSRAGSSYIPRPPPPGDTPADHPALQCRAPSAIAEGAISDRLAGAVDAFLADGCRSQIPILSPAPIFLKDANGIGCEDGASAYLQIETADGVERYIQRCAIPGSTLADLVAALTDGRRIEDARPIGKGVFATITVEEFWEHGGAARACEARAEAMFPDLDFDDPWAW
ncbi:MAG: hypothetical protein ABL308_06650 [Oceanicaulis sp.]